MKSKSDEYVKEWLLYAQDNLNAAKMAMKTEPEDDYVLPAHTICFMCRESAEKYLKAYLIRNGWILKKTHDLKELLKVCIHYDNRFGELDAECQKLSDYIVEGRYPGDLPWEAIGEGQAREAIEATDEIARFIAERIKFD